MMGSQSRGCDPLISANFTQLQMNDSRPVLFICLNYNISVCLVPRLPTRHWKWVRGQFGPMREQEILKVTNHRHGICQIAHSWSQLNVTHCQSVTQVYVHSDNNKIAVPHSILYPFIYNILPFLLLGKCFDTFCTTISRKQFSHFCLDIYFKEAM